MQEMTYFVGTKKEKWEQQKDLLFRIFSNNPKTLILKARGKAIQNAVEIALHLKDKFTVGAETAFMKGFKSNATQISMETLKKEEKELKMPAIEIRIEFEGKA